MNELPRDVTTEVVVTSKYRYGKWAFIPVRSNPNFFFVRTPEMYFKFLDRKEALVLFLELQECPRHSIRSVSREGERDALSS